MKYTTRVAGHLLKFKERVPGIKNAIIDCGTVTRNFTVQDIKAAYFTRFGKELEGEEIDKWIVVPGRGVGWTFMNEIRFHTSSFYLEFLYGSDSGLRGWGRYSYI